MNKLEQAARALLAHWDTPAWKYLKPTGDLMADLREALAEQAEQEQNSMLMEGYRIGLAEMREKCAKVAERFEPDEKCSYVEYASAAIRAIKFEGDTGFRPVSEMIAEHKQDPKKGAAIEKAKMRKATRAEKIAMSGVYEVPVEQAEQEPVAWARTSESGEVLDCISHTYKVTQPCTVDYDEPLYAAPVRTKDLTDAEAEFAFERGGNELCLKLRAVIAAYKEKNK